MGQQRSHGYSKAIAIEAVEYRTDDERLGASERMVAHENILLVLIQLLLATGAIGNIQVLERLIKEAGTIIRIGPHDSLIHLILMKAALEEVDGKAGKFLTKLRTNYLFNINEITFSFVVFLHSSCELSNKKQILPQSIPAISHGSAERGIQACRE